MDGMKLAEQVVAACNSIWKPAPGQRIPLHAPFITRDDFDNVALCMNEQPVGYGFIQELERLVRERIGVKHAIAVSSGTAALHLALIAVGVRPGDEVAVPPLTFAAAAAAVTYCGARPYFGRAVDRSGPTAVIKVDLLGIPAEEDPNLYGAPVIEDAAEALGSSRRGVPCGSMGDIGILSFNNNKIVTTGGGGMVLTNVDSYAEMVRHLATTAKKPLKHFFEHDAIGFNYRMTNLGAALGVGQMERLGAILQFKSGIAAGYRAAFAGMDGVRVVGAPDDVRPNHWLNAIEVPPVYRDLIMNALSANGFECRALFTPLPIQKPYELFFADMQMLEGAMSRFSRTILLPSGNS